MDRIKVVANVKPNKRLEIFVAMNIHPVAFWVMTPFSDVVG
jgi:hypothetical protein